MRQCLKVYKQQKDSYEVMMATSSAAAAAAKHNQAKLQPGQQ